VKQRARARKPNFIDTLFFVGVACIAALVAANAGASVPLPPGFVYLRDVEPAILQDMKYAGPDNFTGARLSGYDAPECILREPVARALKRVQAELEPKGFSLKVYDCYRPARAVRAMRAWADDGKPEALTKRFFPRAHKAYLFSLGYIATRSNHSIGKAVDLTLVPLPRKPAAVFDPAAIYGACIGPASERAPDESIDMGTGFDCFDLKSHTAADDIALETKRTRALLVDAMERQGFRNYAREWWHFDYTGIGGGYNDFPVAPR
jgi:zinc D-Ala-D-Ala dipeptidase